MQNSKMKHSTIVSVRCTFGFSLASSFVSSFGVSFGVSSFVSFGVSSFVSTVTSDVLTASAVGSDVLSPFALAARLARISGLDSFRKKSANTSAKPETPPATNLRVREGE